MKIITALEAQLGEAAVPHGENCKVATTIFGKWINP